MVGVRFTVFVVVVVVVLVVDVVVFIRTLTALLIASFIKDTL